MLRHCEYSEAIQVFDLLDCFATLAMTVFCIDKPYINKVLFVVSLWSIAFVNCAECLRKMFIVQTYAHNLMHLSLLGNNKMSKSF